MKRVPLRDKMPPVYHRFFEPVLDVEFPEERIATCENCTRCRSAQSPFINTKCCDYHPHLANYLVGGLLSDDSAVFGVGQARIREKIAEKKGVTPYGIIPPVAYVNQRKSFYSERADFHKVARTEAESLLCPYYDNGHCSVWKYRENLCVTYFCSSSGGLKGWNFWDKVNEYLRLTERELSKYVLLQLGWPPEEIITSYIKATDLLLENEQGEVDEKKYQKLWRHWAGREEGFYTRAFEIVNSLDAAGFRQITGQDRTILEEAIRQTQARFIQATLPERLSLHPDVQIAQQGPEKALFSLNEQQIEIPALALPLIRAFNGQRTVKEVFDMGFKVLFNMSGVVQELRDKNMLVPA
ncbi:MAG: hypothetical protein KF852_01630 [Saprospiraceae bacterium]|nr:hypothetical protein [Saprospiraceae bacterium]